MSASSSVGAAGAAAAGMASRPASNAKDSARGTRRFRSNVFIQILSYPVLFTIITQETVSAVKTDSTFSRQCIQTRSLPPDKIFS